MNQARLNYHELFLQAMTDHEVAKNRMPDLKHTLYFPIFYVDLNSLRATISRTPARLFNIGLNLRTQFIDDVS